MALPERVGGFLIDLDGTVLEGGELIPGAAEALRTLVQKEIPYRIVTNTTSKPRSAILAKMNELGLELQPEQVITAPIIGRDYLRSQGITRCFPLLKPSLLEDLTAIEFVESSPQAVLVGDIGGDLSYDTLNRAFRFLLEGAAFITLARNRYFRGTDGLCLDVGSIVAALEYATQREAVLIGKPARDFFLLACESMRVRSEATVVIGDDLEADVGGAKAAGCSGVLVQTGKFRADQIEKSKISPDAILSSLAYLPGWLGGFAALSRSIRNG
ncbi:MAG TPA: TIGR01458 family HAD-type hydrolase [Chthoniobacterales bacterium]|jgi:HAD superfamily hydrolase (TIGR01458 family)|nr:TIGR01458 family HAD-type hydrolase [Chthoniobacterales bacterium]